MNRAQEIAYKLFAVNHDTASPISFRAIDTLDNFSPKGYGYGDPNPYHVHFDPDGNVYIDLRYATTRILYMIDKVVNVNGESRYRSVEYNPALGEKRLTIRCENMKLLEEIIQAMLDNQVDVIPVLNNKVVEIKIIAHRLRK